MAIEQTCATAQVVGHIYTGMVISDQIRAGQDYHMGGNVRLVVGSSDEQLWLVLIAIASNTLLHATHLVRVISATVADHQMVLNHSSVFCLA
jgi:hypothetical protein